MQTVVQIWTQQRISADRTERLKYTVPESRNQRIKKNKKAKKNGLLFSNVILNMNHCSFCSRSSIKSYQITRIYVT